MGDTQWLLSTVGEVMCVAAGARVEVVMVAVVVGSEVKGHEV